MTTATDITRRPISDFPGASLEDAKRHADERGLTGFRRAWFVAYDQITEPKTAPNSTPLLRNEI